MAEEEKKKDKFRAIRFYEDTENKHTYAMKTLLSLFVYTLIISLSMSLNKLFETITKYLNISEKNNIIFIILYIIFVISLIITLTYSLSIEIII